MYSAGRMGCWEMRLHGACSTSCVPGPHLPLGFLVLLPLRSSCTGSTVLGQLVWGRHCKKAKLALFHQPGPTCKQCMVTASLGCSTCSLPTNFPGFGHGFHSHGEVGNNQGCVAPPAA